MKPCNYWAVSGQQVALHANNVLKVEGLSLTATTRYLQLHDSLTVPAEDAVPLKSWPITGNAEFYKEFKSGDLPFGQGLYVCLSETEEKKTLSSDTMDLSVELAVPDEPTGTTIDTEDNSGSDVIFQIAVAEPDGPKRLYQFLVVNKDVACYLQLHCQDSVTPGDVPILEWALGATGAASATLHRTFGKSGLLVQTVISGVTKVGCNLVLSSMAGSYTAIAGSENMDITTEVK